MKEAKTLDRKGREREDKARDEKAESRKSGPSSRSSARPTLTIGADNSF